MQVIKGGRVEEQIISIDKILKSLLDRSKFEKQKIITPPIPMSSYNDDAHESLFRYMFRLEGIIEKPMIYVDTLPKEGAHLYIEIHNEVASSRKSFVIDQAKRILTFNYRVEVHPGDMVSVSIEPIGENDSIIGIWFSTLFYVNSEIKTEVRRIIDEGIPSEDRDS